MYLFTLILFTTKFNSYYTIDIKSELDKDIDMLNNNCEDILAYDNFPKIESNANNYFIPIICISAFISIVCICALIFILYKM